MAKLSKGWLSGDAVLKEAIANEGQAGWNPMIVKLERQLLGQIGKITDAMRKIQTVLGTPGMWQKKPVEFDKVLKEQRKELAGIRDGLNPDSSICKTLSSEVDQLNKILKFQKEFMPLEAKKRLGKLKKGLFSNPVEEYNKLLNPNGEYARERESFARSSKMFIQYFQKLQKSGKLQLLIIKELQQRIAISKKQIGENRFEPYF